MHQLTQYMLLLSIVHSCLRVSGITTDNMITTACVASDKDILFSFDLQNEGYAQKIWYVNSTAGTKIAQQIGTGPFIVQSGYSGRVSAYGSAGITLSSVTAADSGVYLLVIYTNITLSSGTASTTVSIFVGADASCKPSCSSDNNPRCMIPEACPAKGSVQVGWFLGQDRQSSDVTCTVNNYGKKYSVCAVGAAVTACYGGEPLCTDHTCTDTTTSICIGVLVPIGCCGIIFIILFCCGCLDCCLLCRIFPHYKTTKSCNATFYCRKKGCLECFFCKGSKEEKGILCCSASKDPEVPLEAETSNRQPSCLCCFCICCDPGQKEGMDESDAFLMNQQPIK